ncbi:MAG: DUF2089 domain-containing protein [Propionibacteriaceae bacterium]|nr:DUF2089 domain-containing protein [Propionibacteriaceae bacterium]
MDEPLYQAPADCPVCDAQLITTRKGCRRCGSELAGEFASSAYDRLDATEHELLRVFLGSRGNLREVEKHLGVSYPTARARFDAVLAKLGMLPESSPATPEPEPLQAESAPDPTTAQEQILARVASGEISTEVAAELIVNLG